MKNTINQKEGVKVLFDTETTGVEEEDRILQIGAMIIDDCDNIEAHDYLCDPRVEIKIEAMETHSITPDMVDGKPRYRNLPIRKRMNDLNHPSNYLIAHNISFDMAMIEKEGFKNNYTLIDTLRLARHLLPDSPYHRLQYLRYSLGLFKDEAALAERENIEIKAHDAIGDVLVMKLLIDKLEELVVAKYPGKDPYVEMAYLSTLPVLIKKFKFGKYKDQLLEDICQNDKGYIKWMRNNIEDMDEDLEFSLAYFMGEIPSEQCHF